MKQKSHRPVLRGPSYHPTLEEFTRKSRQGNLIPVYREILADMETPVSAFLKIRDGTYGYLLESVEGGEKWARYSFLGSRPSLVIRGTNEELQLIRGTQTDRIKVKTDPLETLKTIMADYRPVEVEGLPRFFGGAVGYLGYDLIRSIERLPDHHRGRLDLPLIHLMVTDTLLIFDAVSQKIKVVSNAHLAGRGSGGPDGARRAYREAIGKIEAIIARLKDPIRRQKKSPVSGGKNPALKVVSNMTRPEFETIVRRSKDYIRSGDIFQVVLSQRFETAMRSRPLDVYRALRVINPSPYMYYLKFDGLELVGSSPEVLVRCEDRKIELRPIAGTRPRGRTDEEDRELERELLSDQKECAEHIMLVDLGRNDVGRVSETGQVRVETLMAVERYSHVMHLVSQIEGRLPKNRDVYDVMRAAFPAGTVSGSPKIRAMEIIEELEPTGRGPYAGAVGYFSFSGNMDTCINIRTIVMKDGRAYIQAGAGIVADSDPGREYQETVNKAKAMLAAIEMAEKGLE
ncbi:MAG: anthranilate synthase component I [Nitrospirae bacterium]|nr:anthranilate synthase component I [Nitrospirota bacterium]